MLKTGSESGLDTRKRFITDVIRIYEQRFSEEAEEAKASVRKMKGSRATVYGSDMNKEMRFMLRIPARLFSCLNKLDEPKFLHEDEEMNWFVRTFPKYSVTRKT